jgi:5-methylcytosine-specific restriction endonuclease McrA
MSRLNRLIAAHPLGARKPYNAIKFARVHYNGAPLYTVCKDNKELGAAAALKAAFEKLGGHCFHCGQWMPPQPLSQACTRDHLQPRCSGGGDYRHNLVLACGPCNRSKSGDDLISFRAEAGAKYLKALDAHLVRCIRALAERE